MTADVWFSALQSCLQPSVLLFLAIGVCIGTIIGALPAGFLGVGEPLIYGVTLPMGKPFITAGLGAGFGGAFVMLMHVMSIAWGPSGLVAIPLMKTPIMMLYYFLGLVIAYIMGFIITWFGIKAQDVANV